MSIGITCPEVRIYIYVLVCTRRLRIVEMSTVVLSLRIIGVSSSAVSTIPVQHTCSIHLLPDRDYFTLVRHASLRRGSRCPSGRSEEPLRRRR